MAQPIVCQLGTATSKFCIVRLNIACNITELCNRYDGLKEKKQADLNAFVCNLDERVRVDITNPKYKPAIDNLDVLIDLLCKELAKQDPKFTQARIRKTGSLTAGTRTGMPLEADFLLEVDEVVMAKSELWKPEQLVAFIQAIEPDTWGVNWVFHDVEHHTAGVCLYLEYRPVVDAMGIGFNVDLIPVLLLSQKFSSDKMDSKTKAFLDSRTEAMHKTLHYTHKNRLEKDMAYMHHQLIKDLPNDVKSGYRVAKYLVQSIGCTRMTGGNIPESVMKQYRLAKPYADNQDLFDVHDEQGQQRIRKKVAAGEKALQIFGFSSLIRSYVLQVFLFRLLIETHNTELEGRFTGAQLTLCLLDMLYHMILTTESSHLFVNHPLQTHSMEGMTLFSFKERFNSHDHKMHNMALAALQNLFCFVFAGSHEKSDISGHPTMNRPIEETFTQCSEEIALSVFQCNNVTTRDDVRRFILSNLFCPCRLTVYSREHRHRRPNFEKLLDRNNVECCARSYSRLSFDVTAQYVHTFVDGHLVWCRVNKATFEEDAGFLQPGRIDFTKALRLIGHEPHILSRITTMVDTLTAFAEQLRKQRPQ